MSRLRPEKCPQDLGTRGRSSVEGEDKRQSRSPNSKLIILDCFLHLLPTDSECTPILSISYPPGSRWNSRLPPWVQFCAWTPRSGMAPLSTQDGNMDAVWLPVLSLLMPRPSPRPIHSRANFSLQSAVTSHPASSSTNLTNPQIHLFSIRLLSDHFA